jgi:hypothetical protein
MNSDQLDRGPAGHYLLFEGKTTAGDGYFDNDFKVDSGNAQANKTPPALVRMN